MNFVLRWLIAVVIGICALIGLASLVSHDAAQDANATVRQFSTEFMIARFVIVAAIWCFWNPIIERLMRNENGEVGNAIAIRTFQSKRHHILVLFIIVELLFVQNLLGLLLGWIV